jgi:hypothetical protein
VLQQKIMKICQIDGCLTKHYARGFCRSHYRIESKENAKRWQKIKADPERYVNHLAYMRVKHKEYSVDYKKHADNVYFDGNREKVIERDGGICVFCNLSREEHKTRFGKDIHVHHVDGRGVKMNKKNRNSDISNLLTVCVSCHAKIHHGVI